MLKTVALGAYRVCAIVPVAFIGILIICGGDEPLAQHIMNRLLLFGNDE